MTRKYFLEIWYNIVIYGGIIMNDLKAILSSLEGLLEKEKIKDRRVYDVMENLRDSLKDYHQCTLHKQCSKNNIFEKSDNVVFEWAIKEEIPTNYVSENIAVFGYSPEDFYTGDLKDYWEFVHPEDRNRVRESLYLAREAPIDEYKHRYRVLDANSRTRWVEEWILFERDSNGQLEKEQGILKDVSEIMAISQRLEDSEVRYRDLFENASAIMLIVDQEGMITNVNRNFELEFGITRYDVIRNNMSDYDYLLNTNDILTEDAGEVCIHIHDEERYYRFTTRPILNDGALSEVQIIAHNITEQKCAENEIRYLTEHDKLTGVYSRSYFENALNGMDDHDFGMIVGDVNALKVTNDAFGHKTGDMILIMIAEILKECCTSNEIIARLSGDEFAIISSSVDSDYYQNLITSIHQQCSKIELLPIKPNISLGFAIRKSKLEPKEMVFKRADENMYICKRRESKYIKRKMVDMILDKLYEDLDFMNEELSIKLDIAEQIGAELKFSYEMMEALLMTVRFHDIGNVSIRRGIFYKRQALTHEESANIRKHAETGYHMLLSVPEYSSIAEYVLYHHEWWNGKGYPQGLSGNSIPVISRIVAVIDAYVAMTQVRTYQIKYDPHEAKAKLLELAGMQFDPRIVKTLLTVMNESPN